MSDNNRKKYIIGGVIVALVVIGIVVFASTSSSSSKSSSAGSAAGSAVTSAPTVNVTMAPTPSPALVKTVLFENPSTRAIMIADILLYDDQNVLIPSSNITATVTPQLDNNLHNWATLFPAGFGAGNLLDNNTATFAHTTYNTPLQNMKLVLNNPMKITRIVIKNRVDCCQEHINDLSVKTLNSNGVELSKYVLKGASMKYELTYNPSSGAYLSVSN